MILKATKRIITACVLAAVTAMSCIPVSAFRTDMPQDTDESKFKPAIEMCTILNIMDISESMEFEGSKLITRGDLASIALGMLNLKGITSDTGETELEAANGQIISSEWMGSSLETQPQTVKTPKFSDVDFDNPYHADIQVISDLGIMNGFDDGTFLPENPVVFRDLLKVLVTVLGYDFFAQEAGGYPMGYISMAARLEINNYVSIGEAAAVTKEQAAVLVCNALETDIYDKENEVQTEETLLEKYFNVAKVTGTVTAVKRTGLYSGESDVGDDTVKIGSEIYVNNGIIKENMLGMRLTCYYEKDSTELIYAVSRENHNNEVKFRYSDFNGYDGKKIRYYTASSSKEKSISVKENIPVIVNGVYDDIIKNIDFDFFADYSTDMRVLDAEGDGTYDVLFINTYKTYIVRSVNTDEGRIFVSDVTDSSSSSAIITNDEKTRYLPIELDSSTEYRYFRDGAETTITSLKPDVIISVAESRSLKSDKYADIHISTVKISGTISSINESSLTINGTEYEKVPNANLSELKSGSKGTVYLDINNRVAAYSVDSGVYDYAVLLSGAILEDGENVIFKLFRKNTNSVEIIRAASKITFNNRQTAARTVFGNLGGNDIKVQLVAYKLNGSGEISALTTPTVYNTWNYTSDSIGSGADTTIDRMNTGILSTYTNSSGNAGPGVRAARRCFRAFFADFIPADDVTIFDMSAASESGWQVKTGSSNIKHNREYDCAAYNISYCNAASIMVIFPNTAAVSTKVKEVSYYDSDCVIISGVKKSLSEDDTVVAEISGYVMGKPVVYTMEYDENKEKAEAFQIGDAWQIDADSSGKITAASEIFDARQDYSKIRLVREGLKGTVQNSTVFERTVGIVKETGANAMVIGVDENSSNQGEYYKAPGVTTDSGVISDRFWITKIGIFGAGSTSIYRYDADRKILEVKGVNDIEPNDLVFVSSDYGAPHQILVIRNY